MSARINTPTQNYMSNVHHTSTNFTENKKHRHMSHNNNHTLLTMCRFS